MVLLKRLRKSADSKKSTQHNFLQVIEPTFYLRHDETLTDGQRWVHFGNEQVYIALNDPTSSDIVPQQPQKRYNNYGINHLAWVVDDFEAPLKIIKQFQFKVVLFI